MMNLVVAKAFQRQQLHQLIMDQELGPWLKVTLSMDGMNSSYCLQTVL